MNGILLPILVAATVATFVWGIVALVSGAGGGRQRKLKKRLSVEGRDEFANLTGRSIVIQLQVTGLPPFLARRPFVQRLNRRLLQAYPDRSLGKFLAKAAVIAVVLGGLALLVT